MSREAIRTITALGTGSPGQPPQLSHSSWADQRSELQSSPILVQGLGRTWPMQLTIEKNNSKQTHTKQLLKCKGWASSVGKALGWKAECSTDTGFIARCEGFLPVNFQSRISYGVCAPPHEQLLASTSVSMSKIPNSHSGNPTSNHYWATQKFCSCCSLIHVKWLKIKNYYAQENEEAKNK